MGSSIPGTDAAAAAAEAADAVFQQDLVRFVMVLVANFPMGTVGFGDAIVLHIALTLCSMSFPGTCSGAISEAVFNLTVGGLAAMGVQSALIWKHTNWSLVRLLLPPILAGTGLGLVMLYHIHSFWMKRILGLIFLSVGCYQIHGEVLRAKGLARPARVGRLVVSPDDKELRYWGTVLGTASGFLAGLFGTGGPPLMIFVALYEVEKDEWRASNAVIWFVDNVFRFFYLYWVQGRIMLPQDGPEILGLMLAGGMGVYAGSVASSMVNMVVFRRSLILLMLMGANVMLFAGAARRLALLGMLAIGAGVVLFVLAIWNQPLLLTSKEWAMKNIGAAATAAGGGRWLGNMMYRKVATQEVLEEAEAQDGEEEEEEDAAGGVAEAEAQEEGGLGEQQRKQRQEAGGVEMVKV